MPDFHSTEDEATLYVLGELPAAECRGFEARMAASAELRAMVRELEEGVVALSTGLPERRPPAEVWPAIEQALRRESRWNIPAWWFGSWRSGWAVAAVSLIGWVFYAILMSWHYRHAATIQPSPPSIAANSLPMPERSAATPPLTSTNEANQLLQARTEEVRDLRLKIAEMEKQTGQLAQLLVQQRAQLAESNRIKFYHLSSAPGNGDAATAPLSPALQRAVFLSIGRELGWFPGELNSQPGINAAGQVAPRSFGGVDFVDFRAPNNNTGNAPPADAKRESQLADASAPVIPAYVSGDKIVVAVDSTVASANSALTVSVAGAGTGTTGGSFLMGENPVVVTIPLSVNATSDGAISLTVSSVTPAGQSNTTQFLTPATP